MPVKNYDAVNGLIVGENTGGTQLDYLTDALGSVTATIDSTCTVKNTYRYKPYGDVYVKTGTDPDPKFMWNGSTTSRRTGLAYSGQYDFRRHYGAEQAGWTSIDRHWPVTLPYSYMHGHPTTHSERSFSTGGLTFSQVKPYPTDIAGYSEYYCDLAKQLACVNYGINCFCFVSRNMQKIVKILEGTSFVAAFGGAPGVAEKIAAILSGGCSLQDISNWILCTNKCLFECFYVGGYPGKGKCDPSVTECWKRQALKCENAFMLADAFPEKDRIECCRSSVFCEQEQYGYCNSPKGPCGRLPCAQQIMALMAVASAQQGMSFPFAGNNADRQQAAFQMCCKEKVWSGHSPFR